jgi:hypothetical protein
VFAWEAHTVMSANTASSVRMYHLVLSRRLTSSSPALRLALPMRLIKMINSCPLKHPNKLGFNSRAQIAAWMGSSNH